MPRLTGHCYLGVVFDFQLPTYQVTQLPNSLEGPRRRDRKRGQNPRKRVHNDLGPKGSAARPFEAFAAAQNKVACAKGAGAAIILNLRSGLAWSRPSYYAAGCGQLAHRSRADGIGEQTVGTMVHSGSTGARCRNTSACGLVDAHRWIAGGGAWSMEKHGATGRSLGKHLSGNHRNRFGVAGAWR